MITFLILTIVGNQITVFAIEHLQIYTTMEPLINEVPRDWANWSVISRVRYIENLVIVNLLENNQSIRYIGV